jgi:hypothetical protein
MDFLARYSRGFFESGGMSAIEREAAQEAVKREREHWLPVLEAWLADAPRDGAMDVILCVVLDGEIRRLRRMLGLPPRPSPEAIERRRQQTRERVRRYRQRQLAAGDRMTDRLTLKVIQ